MKNLSMVLPACDGKRILTKAREGGNASGALELARRREIVRKGDRVQGVAALEHRAHGLEDDAVGVEEEVVLADLDKRRFQEFGGEQHRREHGALGGNVLGHTLDGVEGCR